MITRYIFILMMLSSIVQLHQLCLQQVINRIKELCDKRLPKPNISKGKTASYCMKNMIDRVLYK